MSIFGLFKVPQIRPWIFIRNNHELNENSVLCIFDVSSDNNGVLAQSGREKNLLQLSRLSFILDCVNLCIFYNVSNILRLVNVFIYSGIQFSHILVKKHVYFHYFFLIYIFLLNISLYFQTMFYFGSRIWQHFNTIFVLVQNQKTY